MRIPYRFVTIVLALTVVLITSLAPVYGQDGSTRELLREKIEQLWFGHTLTIGEARIASTTVLPTLYERRDFRPAWTRSETVDQLLNAIRDINKDGLNPADYHLAALQRWREEIRTVSPDRALLVNLDVLLTDSLIRLHDHVLFGKVDPEALDPNWNLVREITHADPVSVIQQAIDANSVRQLIDNAKPDHPFYMRLKEVLARYRHIRKEGGWKRVTGGPTLQPGMTDARVPVLRQRLAVTGDPAGPVSNSTVFDEPLKLAVMQFQARHGLVVDGVVGKDTLRALNVPVETRIAQIRVNLERARWVLHEIEGDFVLVDIAGFQVMYVQDGKMSWTSRVQVGKPYRKTPIFKSAIRYLVLNPTWTVPPGILAQDILPAVKQDPQYLRQRNISVIDRAGKRVNPDSLDWARYTARNFPYQLRQEPGPSNALGRIKFIFPNPHLVYLHDTPSKSLFQRTDRAFSSGCIRVEKPVALAELLLNDADKWDQEDIMKAIASKKTRTIFLPKPVPIMLLYWTVGFDAEGRVRFKKDVYKRDKGVLEELEATLDELKDAR